MLAQALGLPNYPGRVRGVGAGVVPTQFYDERPTSYQSTKMDKMEARIDSLQNAFYMIIGQRDQPSGQQSHVPATSESPVVETNSCTMQPVFIPEVIDMIPTCKVLMFLINCLVITKK